MTTTTKTDLQRAFETIRLKSVAYEKLWRYYHGNQPTVYLTSRLQEIFKGVNAVLTENLCSVVVESCLDRLKLNEILIPDQPTLQETLEEILEANQINLESDDLHEAALVTGEAFIIAWKENETADIHFYLNDSGWVHCFYSSTNPREIRFAAKVYSDDDDMAHITLYYADHLEYYVAKRCWRDISTVRSFLPDPEYFDGTTWPANPFLEVPVFHFKTAREARSELTNVIPPQNGINKLLSDMMVAAEYGAFRQRWIISDQETKGKLPSAPGTILDLPAGDGEGQGTSVGDFEVTDMGNYLKAIDSLSLSVAIITRTPKHYFFSQGGDPSGEALIAMEAPLNKKVQDRIDRFTPTWQRLSVFLLKLAGQPIASEEITIEYAKPETVQPRTTADITKIRVDTGIPLDIALRWEGRSQSEIDEIMKLVTKAKAEAQKSLAQALQNQEKNRNNEDQPGNLEEGDEE